MRILQFYSSGQDDVCDESVESVDAPILCLTVTPLHSNQGVESQPPLGFRANQRPPVHGRETANSLEKLQHGRKHLCDGLHGEELVTAWRERGQGLIRNGDAGLNSSHYWTLEAAADRKGPTKV